MAQDKGLVADVGRNSVRFALAEPRMAEPQRTASFHTADHPTFTGALLHYLRDQGLEGASMPCVLAVAGAVFGETVNLTGSRWYVSLSGVEAVLRRPARAINECAASALALPLLGPGDFLPVTGPAPHPPEPGRHYLVLAPGTGMGTAGLVPGGDRLVPVQSEAGHTAFAPATPDEERVHAFLRARRLPVNKEMMVCGPGIAAAYEALGGAAGRRPEDITAVAGRDPAATATVSLVLGALGAIVGELVLTMGAWDGVYMGGPIARALHGRIATSSFRRRMEGQSAFRRQLAQVPVAVVARRDLELVGAVAALANGIETKADPQRFLA